jgi:hypothetical protein
MILAIASGAKAIIDVAVLEEKVRSMRDIILEIKQDTREIRSSIENMTKNKKSL